MVLTMDKIINVVCEKCGTGRFKDLKENVAMCELTGKCLKCGYVQPLYSE